MSAIVPMATPRRTFLSAIACGPAVALLSGAPDAIALLDAAVMAKAAEVRRLISAYEAADIRFMRLWTAYEAAVERELGPRPRAGAEMAAWEASSKAIHERLGVTAADERLDEADDAVNAAIDELAAMPVASVRGLVAKASIFRAPRPFAVDVYSHETIAVAIMRDLGAAIEPEEDADV